MTGTITDPFIDCGKWLRTTIDATSVDINVESVECANLKCSAESPSNPGDLLLAKSSLTAFISNRSTVKGDVRLTEITVSLITATFFLNTIKYGRVMLFPHWNDVIIAVNTINICWKLDFCIRQMLDIFPKITIVFLTQLFCNIVCNYCLFVPFTFSEGKLKFTSRQFHHSKNITLSRITYLSPC